MEQQHNLPAIDKSAAPRSIVAFVPGPGFERIVKELNSEVVLSNDKNAAPAAAEVTKLTGKRRHVIETQDIVVGRLFGRETFSEVTVSAFRAIGAQDGGHATLYYGGMQKEKDAQHLGEELHRTFSNADVEYYYGGMKNAEFWVSLDE